MEHMEIYWMGITYAYIIADMFTKGYVFYRFAKPFLENKKRAFYIGFAYFVTMTILYFIPFEMSNFFAYVIGISVSFFVMCRVDRRNYCQKIFLSVTFFSLRWLSAYMTRVIYGGVDDWIVSSPYMIAHPVLQIIIYAIADIMELATGFVILGVSVRYIAKAYVYKRDHMTVKEMLMLIVPSVTGMTEYLILRYYRDYFEMSTGKIASGIYSGLAFLHYGISIISIVVMTVIFQNIRARQEEKLQNELLAAQMDSIRRHIGQVEDLYQNIRSVRHDMTNHIMTLEKLYAGKETKEAREYAGNIKAALAQMAGEIKSGNPVTDIILQEQKSEAEKRNIRFQCDYHYPAGSNVNAFDISVILSNALQNAIENAGDDKTAYVSILSYRKKNAYMIEISNSFSGDLQWDTENELPVTSKGETDGHGYGIMNIRRVAKKYAGDIDIVYGDGEFRLSILLMMEEG